MEGDIIKAHLPILASALVVIVLSTTSRAGVSASQCSVTMYDDISLAEPVDTITIFQRAYLRVFCTILPVGEYTISTQWMDSYGKLQAEHSQRFTVRFPRYHASTFKFKQMPKGSLTKLLSGEEFEEHQYGRWSVLTFLNEAKIDQKYFTITEN